MELELKHLSAYLPYGLKCLDLEAEPSHNIFTLESVNIHKTVTETIKSNKWWKKDKVETMEQAIIRQVENMFTKNNIQF